MMTLRALIYKKKKIETLGQPAERPFPFSGVFKLIHSLQSLVRSIVQFSSLISAKCCNGSVHRLLLAAAMASTKVQRVMTQPIVCPLRFSHTLLSLSPFSSYYYAFAFNLTLILFLTFLRT